MKILGISFLLLFVYTFASAQVTPLEKRYGVTDEVKNNSINELYNADRLFDAKKYNESLQVLVKVANADPVILNTYESMYKACMELKNCNQTVLNCFAKGKEIYRNNDEISFFYAEILTVRKDYRGALSEYNNAISIQQNKNFKSFYSPYYYSSRGFCHLQMKSFSLAEKDFSDFLRLKPKDPTALLNRGLCYYKLGNTQKAKQDWETASQNGSSEAKEFLKKLR